MIGNTALDEKDPNSFECFEGILPSRQILNFSIPLGISAHLAQNHWRNRAAEFVREDFLRNLDADIVFVSSLFEGGFDDACTSTGRLSSNALSSTSLYDLIPMTEPEKYLGTPWTMKWYSEKIEHLQKFNQLLSISNYSKLQAQELLGIEASKIVNISTACDELFRQQHIDEKSARELRLRYGVHGKLIVCSGALDERKNIPRLLEAFSTLPPEIRATRQLLIAGKGSEHEVIQLCGLAKKFGIEDRLILPGYVPDSDLARLIALAEFFIFPSLSEGFGLPPLEAMSCGTPTLASNSTSLPEVIGWDEAMFDPHSIASIARAMHRTLVDSDFYDQLKAHALIQSKKFSWERSASLALDAFEQIHEQTGLAKRRRGLDWSSKVEGLAKNHADLITNISRIEIPEALPSEEDLRETAQAIAQNSALAKNVLRRLDPPNTSITWRIEGPFDSTYSLALVNREIALALRAAEQEVALHSSEGPGDYAPDGDFLVRNPKIAELHRRSLHAPAEKFDVTTRNMFPPRVNDVASRTNFLHCYAWEESGFPSIWVDDFNEHLQGIGCVSEHVKKILIDNGVTVPLWVNGGGVDHWESVTPNSDYKAPGKGYRFLHVSSCFPRKGADILLKAYGAAFSYSDPVCLVIKTFKNVHNRINDWIEDARAERPDFPKIHVIEEDLSDSDLKALYLQCNALVAPSKAEGFGLPLAEAMLCGLEVIATNWSGQLDFCNSDTAWLIDYKLERAQSHLEIFDSYWACPDLEHLSQLMRTVYSAADSLKKAEVGRANLLRGFKWSNSAQKLIAGAEEIFRGIEYARPKIGWISTWNTKCGIATYSEHLTEDFPQAIKYLAPYADELTRADHAGVVRCWNQNTSDDLGQLSRAVASNEIDTLVIQFNYGFFDFLHLRRFIEDQAKGGVIVVIVLHSTQDPADASVNKRLSQLVPAFKLCTRVVVHSINDLNRLKVLGLETNTMLFPHGVLEHRPPNVIATKTSKIFKLATYGFFLPHKGLLEFIDAIEILRNRGVKVEANMVNAEYPAAISKTLVQQARATIEKKRLQKHITLSTQFLDDEESLALLDQADLIVFAYQNTGESASGAVRYGLATRKPVAVTPLPIFEDISSAVFKLPGSSPSEIADGLEKIILMIKSDAPLIGEISKESNRWVEEHSYSKLARRFGNFLQALKNAKVSDNRSALKN
ncbi:glycosyltransferase involved in cell wall biosynthesis [Variovorax boronicumulans]|uniref:glycosyltransferase n=1 Tax=Variovorax boronicumulans TaxID=436515 RepID=UPI002781907F|nr:glycosyltransferase [Variovorax boronicumulans]MDP9994303.1 glycosyltransferase involved in cell wall biosynthesis [Variovorax boronicumulans]MDQ0005404.1 glycosyltransferase involved in cell wall biosynthesis [Variovorax boronicumulans]